VPLAISLYSLSVGVHVVFVVSFLAAAGAFSVIGPMAKENPEHAIFALKVEEKIYKTLVFPGILVVWGTGIYQSSDGNFSGDDLWLWISVALFAFMTFATFVINYPAVKNALSELESQTEPGPPSESAQKSLKTLATFGPIMGITFLVIAFLMGAKPF
jgi:uncharacterized membrane protein